MVLNVFFAKKPASMKSIIGILNSLKFFSKKVLYSSGKYMSFFNDAFFEI